MSAAHVARRLGAVALVAWLALATTGCTDDEAVPDGSTAIAPSSAPVVTDAATTTSTTQVPTEATPLVRQAVLDYWAAQQRCQQRPQVCRPRSFTADQGGLRADVEAAVTTLLTNGWHRGSTTADDTDDGGYVAVGPIIVAPDGTTATVDECVYDPAPLMDAKGVVTSDAVPHRFSHTVYLEDGTWRVGDEQVDASGACEDAPDAVPPDLTTPGT
jgi:hypothetical protein